MSQRYKQTCYETSHGAVKQVSCALVSAPISIEKRVSLEAHILSVKKFPAFFGTQIPSRFSQKPAVFLYPDPK